MDGAGCQEARPKVGGHGQAKTLRYYGTDSHVFCPCEGSIRSDCGSAPSRRVVLPCPLARPSRLIIVGCAATAIILDVDPGVGLIRQRQSLFQEKKNKTIKGGIVYLAMNRLGVAHSFLMLKALFLTLP